MSAGIIEGGNTGFWSPRTATLDWCEENYVVWHYIAEFWNTLSNSAFLLYALVGLERCYKYQMEKRFYLCYLSLALIAVGSALFHGTLIYEMQLLDEIPMLYAGAMLYYSFLEKGKEKKYGITLPILLLAVTTGTTIMYVVFKNPHFHHTSYGILSALSILDGYQSAKHAPKPVGRLLLYGIFSFLLAFGFWNVDNFFCDSLRDVRNQILDFITQKMLPKIFPFYEIGHVAAQLLAFFFQFHAWWHIFSGWGGYVAFVYLEYHRLALGQFKGYDKERPRENAYYSETISKDGELYQIGISFWFSYVPYVWCQKLSGDLKSPSMQEEVIVEKRRRQLVR